MAEFFGPFSPFAFLVNKSAYYFKNAMFFVFLRVLWKPLFICALSVWFLNAKKVDQLAQIGVKGGEVTWAMPERKHFFSGTPVVSIATSLPIASGWLTSAVGSVTDGEEKSASAVCAPPPGVGDFSLSRLRSWSVMGDVA